MRAGMMGVLLGACRVVTPSTDSTSDTVDDSDTDAVQADTDPIAPDTDVQPGDTDDACLSPLIDTGGGTPQSWQEVAVAAQQACVTTTACDPDLGASAMLSWMRGAAGSDAYFDSEGNLVAVHRFSDVGGCAEYGYGSWFGPVVAGCTQAATPGMESAPCASPSDLAVPGPGCVTSWPPRVRVRDLAGWADVAALGRVYCVGLATCTLGERQLDLVYHDNATEDGAVDVWERTTGALVANLEPWTVTGACGAGPHWVGEDLSACLPVVFTPSTACGVVALP
jgi:hypothetical protein